MGLDPEFALPNRVRDRLTRAELTGILKREEVELLSRTRDVLEEILETVEVASDCRALRSLQEGLRDIRSGRVRPYADFAKELRRYMT